MWGNGDCTLIVTPQNKKILIDINGDRTNNKYKNNDKQKNK